MDTIGRRNVVWKTPTVSQDGLKLFACLMMLLYDAGTAVVENAIIGVGNYTQAELSAAMETDAHLMTWTGVDVACKLLGGLALPLFAYLLVEGFLHTESYRNYLVRVVSFAVISEIPYDLAIQGSIFDFSSQNAMLSVAVCLLLLYFLNMLKEKRGFSGVLLKLLMVLCGVAWVTLLRAQHGLGMVLLAAIFYLFHDKTGVKTVLGILVSLLYTSAPLAFYGIYCCGEERTDRFPKFAYYIFYPAHLLLLWLISAMLSGSVLHG